jgi:hypothetical protein
MEAMTALLVKRRDHLIARQGVCTMLEQRDGTARGDETRTGRRAIPRMHSASALSCT